MQIWKLSLAVLVFATLNACASIIDSLEAPSVKLSSLALGDMSLSNQKFVVNFDVDNPNPFPIPVKAVDYGIRLAGQSFASGSTENAFTLPASGKGQFSLSINTNLIQTAQTLSQVFLQGGQRELDYDLEGSFQVNLPFVSAVPFNQKGVVSIDR